MNKYRSYFYELGVEPKTHLAIASIHAPFRKVVKEVLIEDAIAGMKVEIDKYYAECAENGVAPAQQFTGSITVRLSPAEHQRAYGLYQRSDAKTFSAWVRAAVNEKTGYESGAPKGDGINYRPDIEPFLVTEGIPEIPYVPQELPQNPVDAALFLLRGYLPNRTPAEKDLWEIVEHCGRLVSRIFNEAVSSGDVWQSFYTPEEQAEQFSLLRESYASQPVGDVDDLPELPSLAGLLTLPTPSEGLYGSQDAEVSSEPSRSPEHGEDDLDADGLPFDFEDEPDNQEACDNEIRGLIGETEAELIERLARKDTERDLALREAVQTTSTALSDTEKTDWGGW